MNLSRHARETYAVEVTLDPVAAGEWEASFDAGTTWLSGSDLGDGSTGWLVAGTDNDGTGAAFQFGAGQLSVTPLLRLDAGAEQIVVRGPSIDLD